MKDGAVSSILSVSVISFPNPLEMTYGQGYYSIPTFSIPFSKLPFSDRTVFFIIIKHV